MSNRPSLSDDFTSDNIIAFIKSNARLLYGRHMTYDIVTTAPPPRPTTLATAKYDGQKVHALLIGYTGDAQERGKLLRGTYSVGVSRTPPTVGYALQLLHDELRVDVGRFVGKLNFGFVLIF